MTKLIIDLGNNPIVLFPLLLCVWAISIEIAYRNGRRAGRRLK